jgi:hypothetical protein
MRNKSRGGDGVVSFRHERWGGKSALKGVRQRYHQVEMNVTVLWVPTAGKQRNGTTRLQRAEDLTTKILR